MSRHQISLEVNGSQIEREIPARMSLADFLREELNLTGTHIGCEHGVCGCCTALMDGEPIRTCIILAVQADGHKIVTIEGISTSVQDDTGQKKLSHIQEAFWECHGLQCGFCTPGMIITTKALLDANPNPTEQEIREELSGNICRCTGYVQIVEAVQLAAKGGVR
jgi:carbon-monoxide dehydrogenase small subunit